MRIRLAHSTVNDKLASSDVKFAKIQGEKQWLNTKLEQLKFEVIMLILSCPSNKRSQIIAMRLCQFTRPYSLYMDLKKILVNDNIKASSRTNTSPKQYIKHWILTTTKHCEAKNFSKITIAIRFSLLQVCPSVSPFVWFLCHLYLLFLNWTVIFMFHANWWQFSLLEFWDISWHRSFNLVKNWYTLRFNLQTISFPYLMLMGLSYWRTFLPLIQESRRDPFCKKILKNISILARI